MHTACKNFKGRKDHQWLEMVNQVCKIETHMGWKWSIKGVKQIHTRDINGKSKEKKRDTEGIEFVNQGCNIEICQEVGLGNQWCKKVTRKRADE